MKPSDNPAVGRWRIVEADLWDRDQLDLCGPASGAGSPELQDDGSLLIESSTISAMRLSSKPFASLLQQPVRRRAPPRALSSRPMRHGTIARALRNRSLSRSNCGSSHERIARDR
jgi:hypothetical protein